MTTLPEGAVCRFGGVDDGTLRVCCSSHNDVLCAHHYARTHFVMTDPAYDGPTCVDAVELSRCERVVSDTLLSSVLEHRASLPVGANRSYWTAPDANHRRLMAKSVVAALKEAGFLAAGTAW